MKASELLCDIQKNLNDYPIEYLKSKANNDRYPDSIIKRLAEYNSKTYDEIYDMDLIDDFEIKDSIIDNFLKDIRFYFDTYDPGDDQARLLSENICIYLAFIAKKPLHPFTNDKKDEIYYFNGNYYCKGRISHIREERSLCRYCICKNVSFSAMF